MTFAQSKKEGILFHNNAVEMEMGKLYKALEQEDLEKAAKAAYNLAKNLSPSEAKLYIKEDFTVIDQSGVLNILYKGKSIVKWQDTLPIKKDLFTGFEYFELGGYKILTDEYICDYDRNLANLSLEKGISVEDLHQNNIFTKDMKRFTRDIKAGFFTDNNYSKGNFGFEKYATLGTDLFKKVMAFVIKKDVQEAVENGSLKEEDFLNEIKGYDKFKKDFDSIKDFDQKKRLLEEEFFDILDRHHERIKKSNEFYEHKRQEQRIIKKFKKNDLDERIKNLDISRLDEYKWS